MNAHNLIILLEAVVNTVLPLLILVLDNISKLEAVVNIASSVVMNAQAVVNTALSVVINAQAVVNAAFSVVINASSVTKIRRFRSITKFYQSLC